jgi:ribosomal protein S18 acetylase RimI-like enzyme
MIHVLDNPAWNALTCGNKHLANGDERAKYFDQDVSPFVGLKDNSEADFNALYKLLPFNRTILFVSAGETNIPFGWKLLSRIEGLQMVFEQDNRPNEAKHHLLNLTQVHVAQMLELTKLTNPGPFVANTIAFGNYKGLFDNDKLIAMAGHRLQPAGYIEISAVCTHPNYLGKGYARALLLDQINDIKAVSATPFLHVRKDNVRAVKVYHDLGFTTRTNVTFYVLQKEEVENS